MFPRGKKSGPQLNTFHFWTKVDVRAGARSEKTLKKQYINLEIDWGQFLSLPKARKRRPVFFRCRASAVVPFPKRLIRTTFRDLLIKSNTVCFYKRLVTYLGRGAQKDLGHMRFSTESTHAREQKNGVFYFSSFFKLRNDFSKKEWVLSGDIALVQLTQSALRQDWEGRSSKYISIRSNFGHDKLESVSISGKPSFSRK